MKWFSREGKKLKTFSNRIRANKVLLNLISDYILKVVQIVSSLLLARLILNAYGSEINGLVSSINQFLSVIVVTDMGVSTVIQSALYSPLVAKDEDKISAIMASSSKFYKTIGFMMVIYTLLLCIFYPRFTEINFDYWFVASLIIILSIDSIVKYLFGVTRSMLLNADQHHYIQSFTSVIGLCLNFSFCIVLINSGYSIRIVKMITMFCYMINPIVYILYVNKHYTIDWHIKYEVDPIKQKWDGFAYKITEYIYSYTDIIVLTVFSTLINVSVYAVYNMVLTAIRQCFAAISTAMQPYLGLNLARKDLIKVRKVFKSYEYIIQFSGTIIFGCTMTLIVPFVMIYTNGVTDAEYKAPCFAFVLTIATYFRYYSIPFLDVIFAVGHFKQTQKYYLWSAVSNVLFSIIFVCSWGLTGVAVGTLISALYNVIWQGRYVYIIIYEDHVNILQLARNFLKNLIILFIGYILTKQIKVQVDNYYQWILLAVVHFLIWFFISILINLIMDKNELVKLYDKIFGRFVK